MIPVIHSEVLFNERECEDIINFHKTYTDLIFRSKEPFIDLANHRIYTESTTRSVENIGKFFYVYDIPNTPDTSWMFVRLAQWFFKTTGVNLRSNNPFTACSLHRYVKGDFFQKHIDIREGFADRRYNIGIQLNNNYEGGDYNCWDSNENMVTFPKDTGTTLLYTGDLLHEITEITEGERWSIVLAVSRYDILEKSSVL